MCRTRPVGRCAPGAAPASPAVPRSLPAQTACSDAPPLRKWLPRRWRRSLRQAQDRLVALDAGLHKPRRDQPDLMPELRQLTRPVVRPGAGLHPDPARRQVGEKFQHLAALERLAQNRLALLLGAVHLEYVLCQIETDLCNLHGDFFLFLFQVVVNISHLGTSRCR